ncbi:hypothetical protein P1J78_17150 [Psychromarinibacter sp. C21-152]|uniref:Uncharacterized protein n=1 Tax=Psychromarinibacter sediminicola TaxID=3033385 RepID=A0AAE3T9P9_9RHOB|nr:hypothetical protein [Psychromarinibacter sediminicola]MDF0602467.1 hypothetical protein [Psychromarinibacter sediminicola]
MSDATARGGQSAPAFWRRLPDMWKFVTVLLAIAATAIGGYKWVDDTIDGMQGQIDALSLRIDGVASDMVPPSELENYVSAETLQQETCNLNLQLQLLEFRALSRAYGELFQMMNAAADLYRGRALSPLEEQQLAEIVRRRSSIATKKEEIDSEMDALQRRALASGGCA